MNSLALCLARICVEFRISHFEFSALLLAWLLGLANSTAAADTYAVVQSRIYKNGLPVQWRGANALDVYSVTESDMQAMDSWGLDIVREVVGNMRDNPLSGGPQNIGGSWLYSLQSIVDAHRAHGRVTILCPFNWDGASANQFVGKNPSSMPWFTDYLTRYREWATQFKDQPDVWFELWNEPYDWQGGNGYSEALWLADMQTMVDNIRSIAPNNLILVPGARMGGDETVIAHQGPALLAGRTNLVFDCHAYEAWLYDSQASVESRVRSVQNSGCTLLFAEMGVINSGPWMNPANFLRAMTNLGLTTLAWIWKCDNIDGNALRDASCQPHDTPNNFNWGSTYRAFALGQRSPETNGLWAEYFDDANLTALKRTRFDSTIDFSWGNGSPGPAINTNRFSVRWTGRLVPRYTETYTFSLTNHGGVRLWLNGVLLLNRWQDSGPTNDSITAALTANRKYDLRLEYCDTNATALVQLSWTSPSQPRQVIPMSQFLPSPGGTNAPPMVWLTVPAANALFASGTSIPLSAAANDLDGSVAAVEFRVGKALLATVTNRPFTFTWSNPPAGQFDLSAVAYDDEQAAATSTVASVNVAPLFIPAGSLWKYNDSGANLGTAWRSNSFNDATWPAGAAELGFGDSADGRPETTPIVNRQQIACYFRSTFTVPAGTSYSNLTARLLRDDGAVVYVNGAEVWRSNLPTNGPILYNTLAPNTIGGTDETVWHTNQLAPLLLAPGTNLVAVEVHQSTNTSSDLSFDFELSGQLAPSPTPMLNCQLLPQALQFRWPLSASTYALVTTTNLTPPTTWTPVAAPLRLENDQIIAVVTNDSWHRFFRLLSP